MSLKSHFECKLHFIKQFCRSIDAQFNFSNSFKNKFLHSFQSFESSSAIISKGRSNLRLHKVLHDLGSDNSIKVCSFDKGSGVVILDSIDYFSKLDNIINDSSKFTEILVTKSHPVVSNENKLVRFLNSKVKPFVSHEVLKSIIPCGSQPGKLYGLCKVHKENFPLRPVVSMINTAEYKLAQFLDSFIKPNIPGQYILNSTHDFLSRIKKFKFNPDDSLISFDVESLFTNVPLQQTIDIISQYVYSPNSASTPPFPVETFKQLLCFATSGIFMYNNKFYRQTDGICMGSPLGPTFANFFLGHLEQSWLSNSNVSQPRLFLRYVDDIFCVFSKGVDFNNFLNMLNSTHPNLKFTFETGPSKLAFLDTSISLTDKGCEYNVYRKKTFTNLCLNFNAFCPMSWKLGIIYCFLNRAFLCCSSFTLFHKEAMFLKDLLNKNGYPFSVFYKCLNHFLNNVFSTNPTNKVDNQSNYVLCIPFLGKPSLIYKKKLINLFQSHCNIKINCVFQSCKVSRYFSLKCPTPIALKSKVVYSFTCSRDANTSYIGMTKRHLGTRASEHKNVKSPSPISSHLLNCSSCSDTYNVNSFKILSHASNNFDLQIREALLIKSKCPSLNNQLSNSGSSFFLNVF